MPDSSEAPGVLKVVVDDADPRDPSARCDRCGTRGTIARATRHSDPPLVTRYCGACWPAVESELEVQREAERARHRVAFQDWVQSSRRNPASVPPRPPAPASFSSASRSWHDIRKFLERVSLHGAALGSEDLAHIARDIRSRTPVMEGPMPVDVATFVDQHDPPATNEEL